MIRKYIEILDKEIERLISEEVQRARVNPGAEQQLHFLFENRRHAMEWAGEAGHHDKINSDSRGFM